jgi:predicted metal-dependent hydrolase
MKGSTEDAVGEATADFTITAGVVEAAEDVAVALAVGAVVGAVVQLQVTTHPMNGTSYLLRNATRFTRSMTRKENRVEQNDRLVIYWSSSSQQ